MDKGEEPSGYEKRFRLVEHRLTNLEFEPPLVERDSPDFLAIVTRALIVGILLCVYVLLVQQIHKRGLI